MLVTEQHFQAIRIAAKGLDGVEVVGPNRIRLNKAGRCSDPVGFERTLRDYRKHGDKFMEITPASVNKPMFLEGEVRCRRCEQCLRARASEWTARAVSECRVAARTWFGTLTLGPDIQMRTLMRARALAFETLAGDYDAMPYGEQFVRRVDVIGPDLQRYMKRVRKDSDARLRYLLVAERHKSGDPHFHMLVHECSMEQPVRERILSGQWGLGFSQWRLADEKSARYVCKYLAKTLAARVRASQCYGTPPLVLANANIA